MTTYVYTSISTNYLPKARVLARTLKEHNPDVRFVVFFVEPIPAQLSDLEESFDETISLTTMDIPQKSSWIFQHTLVEICTAIKGFALELLLARNDCDAVFYIDPDIALFAPLTEISDHFSSSSILLTPHLTDAEKSYEGILDNELSALRHGVYNLGFLGVKNSRTGREFAHWWSSRLYDFCFDDIPNGIFTDQRWIDLVPAYFGDEVAIVRHAGCNVATWNLPNRVITGDFNSGFKVNGQPLIFYHFSGLDSGAQLIMLSKYGQEVPAAHLLRNWYIDFCNRLDDGKFHGAVWIYDFFANGEPISRQHRELYRRRADLQEYFPDPFACESVGQSYYHWYSANSDNPIVDADVPHSRLTYPSSMEGKNALEYFISHLDDHMLLSPTPLFDPQHYLSLYPDVRLHKANPYAHYVADGYREGRNPNSTFDTAYYRQEYSTGIEPGQNALAHYVEYGKSHGFRTSPIYDSDRDRDAVVKLVALQQPRKPTILFVSQPLGGGVATYVHKVVSRISRQCNAFLLHRVPHSLDYFEVLDLINEGNRVFHFHKDRQTGELLEVLRLLNISRIHIQHLWRNERYLRQIVQELAVPFDVTIHDYFLLSPQPFLCDGEGFFVGDPFTNASETLLENSMSEVPVTSLDEWRYLHEWVIEDASRVICPSYDVAKRFQPHYPSREFLVAAHPEPADLATVPIALNNLAESEPLRVLILGALPTFKGSKIIEACATFATDSNAPIQFHLVGFFLDPSSPEPNSHLTIHGEYNKRNIGRLLSHIRPHVAWFTSLCPETYSYTLSEALEHGLPVVVPNLGAMAERVAGRAWSWVRPWDSTPLEWLEFFLRIRMHHFMIQIAPPVTGTQQQPTSNFYPSDYLYWVDQQESSEASDTIQQLS